MLAPDLYQKRAALWLVRKDPDKALADMNAAIRLGAATASYYRDRACCRQVKRDHVHALKD